MRQEQTSRYIFNMALVHWKDKRDIIKPSLISCSSSIRDNVRYWENSVELMFGDVTIASKSKLFF